MSIPINIQKHLAGDAALLPHILQFSEELDLYKPHTRIYEVLIEAIIGQQLSGKAADSIRRTFRNAFNGMIPESHTLIQTQQETLRGLGLSNSKAQYLKNVAQFWIDNNLELTDWASMSEDAIIDLLTQIKGVGKWTVEMVLIFDLARDDVFPIDDLGVQNGLAFVYNKRKTAKGFKKWALRQSARWSPYRSWGSRLMWKAYDASKKK